MSDSEVLAQLLVVIGTAAVITLAFQALRLPGVLGFIVAGVVIGPHVPVPLVANFDLVHFLSELGVIFLMFGLGLELRISTLARVGVGAGLTALFEVATCLGVGALVASMLGFAPGEAVFAGACLGISSTMLVAKAFEHLGWRGGFTEVVFAILIFEDLIAIILLAVLTGLATGHGLEPVELAITLGELAGFLAAMLAGGLLVVPRLMREVVKRGRAETLLIVALAICFGGAVLAHHFEYSVALGSFAAGLLVAESGHGHEVTEIVKPFGDVFAMMFFVSIGMTIEPMMLVDELPTILVFTGVVLLFKPIGVSLGSIATGRGVQPSIRAGVSLAQNGELSFVIAGIGTAAGVARPSLLAIAVGVTCLTTFTSSVMIRSSEPIAAWLSARLPERFAVFVSFYESWLDRLRSRESAAWRRVRRPVIVLVLDTAAVVAVIIGGSILFPKLAEMAGLTGWLRNGAIVLAVIAAAAPFCLGAVLRVVRIARILALIVIPSGGDVDLGRAPRRALTLTLELALSAVLVVLVLALIAPFVGQLGLLVGGVILALIAITYRSIVDFTHHAKAGSELILELLKTAPPETAHDGAGTTAIGSQVETVLPGFGGVVTITIDPLSHAVGKSLAELNLRARTGASVLAIGRGGGGFASPTPTEPLHAGDVLAINGSDGAIEAAKLTLSAPAAVAVVSPALAVPLAADTADVTEASAAPAAGDADGDRKPSS